MADRTVTYEFRGKFTSLTAGLTAAGKSVSDLGGKMTALDKNGAKMRAGLTSVGDTAGKIGLVAAAGLGAAVLTAAKFDKAMSAVQAATGETASNMDKLREAALQAGADTAYSASEAAAAIEELAKAGVSTTDIIGGGLTGSLDLAAAGAVDVAKAAEISATAMTQFGLNGTDVVHIADLLAAGAGKAQGSVEDLGMALSQSGLVASQVGLSIEETTGGLAAFASAGLIGSDSGTAFKTMLGALSPNSKEAAQLMSELGINAYDAQGNFIGLADFAGNLKGALEGMTDQQRQSTLETIFGSDAVRAASVLYEQGSEGIQSWIDKTNDAGFAAETAATRLDNLSGDFEKLKGSLETALIGAGSGSEGPLRQLVQGLTGAVDAFNDLPPAAKNTASALAGVVAVTGGAAFFGSKVITGIADTKQALSDLGVSGEKSGKALRGVRAAAVGAASGLAALAIIDQIQVGAADALPGVEALTGSLLDLANAGGGSGLPEEFDNLSASIERLANPNTAQNLQDNISDALGGIGGGSELKNARAELDALDAALTNLVATAGAGVAKEAFSGIVESAGLSGGAVKDLSSLLPEYGDALAGAANQTTLTATSTDGLTAGLNGLSNIMGLTAETSAEFLEEQKQIAEATAEARKAAEETAGSFVALGASLNDSKVSLGDWIGELESQAKALRDFRKNAVEAGEKGVREGLVAALREAGPEGAMRLAQLADASEKEIRRANRAYEGGQKEIQRYADKFGQIPDAKTTEVTAKTQKAQANIDAVLRVLGIVDRTNASPQVTARTGNSIPLISEVQRAIANLRDKTVTITTVRRAVGGAVQGAINNADGGEIMGQRQPYGDKVLSWLAPGEEIISNRHGQADQFRADRAAGRIPGYADGGTSGQRPRAQRSAIVDGDDPRVAAAGLTGRRRLEFLRDFERDAKKSLRGLERAADAASASVDDNKAAVDRETSARDALVQQFDGLVADIAGQFRTDLFEPMGDVWSSMSATSDPIARLQADIASSDQFSGMFAGLQARGASGDALTYAAQQGSDALATLSAYTDDQLRQYGELFALREQRASAVGTQVAQQQFGEAVAQANAYAAETVARLDQANAELAEANRIARLQTQATEQAGEVVAAEQRRFSSSAAKGKRSQQRRRRE